MPLSRLVADFVSPRRVIRQENSMIIEEGEGRTSVYCYLNLAVLAGVWQPGRAGGGGKVDLAPPRRPAVWALRKRRGRESHPAVVYP